LLEQVWGYPGDDEEAKELSKVHINRIRQKMRAIAPEADLPILSVRGFGYMLLSVKR
jgi:DNA-binding response OmpR family regulator